MKRTATALTMLCALLVALWSTESIVGAHLPKRPKPKPKIPKPDVPSAPTSGINAGTIIATGPGATTPGGRTPGVTRNRKSGARSVGEDRWELWWAYNWDSYVRIRERLEISGSADWLLGRFDRRFPSSGQVPTERMIGDELLPALRSALDDGFFDVRLSAALAIGKAGDASDLPRLEALLSDEHPRVGEAAALAIGLLGDPSGLPVLRELLADTAEGRKLMRRPDGIPYRTRAFAAVGAGLIGDPSCIDDLLRIARPGRKEPNQDVPVCAVIALGLLGESGEGAVGSLHELFSDSRTSEVLRSYIVTALGQIGSADSRLLLRRALRDQSSDVRRSAVLALGRIGVRDPACATLLRRTIHKGSDPQSRNWACISLAKIGAAEDRKFLELIVAHETGSLQAYGAIGLAILARRIDEVTEVARMLRRKLERAADPSFQGALAVSLGILGDGSAERDLLRLLAGPCSPALRGYAAMALGMIDAQSARAHLARIVTDRASDAELRRSAAIGLGMLGDRNVVSLLTDVIRRAKTEHVQASAALALGYLGDSSAIAPLASILASESTARDLARVQAANALGLIGDRGALPALNRLREDTNYRAAIDSLVELLSIT